MKLPMVTKALEVVALVGAASASASVIVPLGSTVPMPMLSNTGIAPGVIQETHSAVDPAGNFKAQVESSAEFDGLSLWTYSYRVTALAGGPGVGNHPIQSLIIPLISPVFTSVVVDQTPSMVIVGLSDAVTLNSSGGSIGFVWRSGPMMAGETSQWVSFQSTLPPLLKTVGVQDGTCVNVAALIPVPEPATYAGLLALGLVGFAAFRRFRPQSQTSPGRDDPL